MCAPSRSAIQCVAKLPAIHSKTSVIVLATVSCKEGGASRPSSLSVRSSRYQTDHRKTRAGNGGRKSRFRISSRSCRFIHPTDIERTKDLQPTSARRPSVRVSPPSRFDSLRVQVSARFRSDPGSNLHPSKVTAHLLRNTIVLRN